MRRFLLLVAALSLMSAVTVAQTRSMSKNVRPKAVPMQKMSRMGDENLNANVENSNPGIVRENQYGELDNTYYDWQSNHGPITRTIVWPDGKINFAYTYAPANSNLRGTGIGTYDSNTGECIPLNSRVENERTGFGSIARYGENSIVVAAHTATTVGLWMIEDKDNIPTGTLEATSFIDGTYVPAWPSIMTSGENRDIIHIIATSDGGTLDMVQEPLLYYRSTDGGQTWDKQNVLLPYLTADYTRGFEGANTAYWLETTESNRLTLIVNSSWIDGMAIYSDDDGETWNVVKFYDWPDPYAVYEETDSVWVFYPRYVSGLWDKDNKLHIAYEWNATGDLQALTNGSYYPSLGGIGYWNETLPYNSTNIDTGLYTEHVTGEPFVIDTAYLYNDMYASWWRWSDASHLMWPEFLGTVMPLDAEGNPEDPYTAEEFNISDFSLHGSYNCGIASFPMLCYDEEEDFLVALWSAMDENNVDGNGNFYFKIFARSSNDGGLTWSDMIQLTTDFSYSFSECTYTQAVIYNRQLIIASQMDGNAGTYVQFSEDGQDGDGTDNMYQVLALDLYELFPETYPDGVGETETPTYINLYPNPASQTINVNINKSSDVVIYNIVGQAVKSFKGHMGINTVDVSSFTPGVYFMTVGDNTQKFVVK